MSVFFLVFATLIMFALCWFLCHLLGDAPVDNDNGPSVQKGCWEGGAGVDRSNSVVQT